MNQNPLDLVKNYTLLLKQKEKLKEKLHYNYQLRLFKLANLKRKLRVIYREGLLRYETLRKPIMNQTLKKKKRRRQKKFRWKRRMSIKMRKIKRLKHLRMVYGGLKKGRYPRTFKPRTYRMVNRVYIYNPQKALSRWFNSLIICSSFTNKSKQLFSPSYQTGFYGRGFRKNRKLKRRLVKKRIKERKKRYRKGRKIQWIICRTLIKKLQYFWFPFIHQRIGKAHKSNRC